MCAVTLGNQVLLKNQLLVCTGCICTHIKATGLKSVATEVSEYGDGAVSSKSAFVPVVRNALKERPTCHSPSSHLSPGIHGKTAKRYKSSRSILAIALSCTCGDVPPAHCCYVVATAS